jgi:hypothetical protein
VRHVLVNGQLAVKDGTATGIRAGRAQMRSANMPSRPAIDRARSLSVKGTVDGKRVTIDLTQRAGAREASGSFSFEGFPDAQRFGILQASDGWASVTFINAGHAMRVTVDLGDAKNAGAATLIVNADHGEVFRGTLPSTSVVIK